MTKLPAGGEGPGLVTIRITAVHLGPGGPHHEHIEQVRWETTDGTHSASETSVPIVAHLIEANQFDAIVGEDDGQVSVFVRRTTLGRKYLQTAADGEWTNNMLSLPRY